MQNQRFTRLCAAEGRTDAASCSTKGAHGYAAEGRTDAFSLSAKGAPDAVSCSAKGAHGYAAEGLTDAVSFLHLFNYHINSLPYYSTCRGFGQRVGQARDTPQTQSPQRIA